MSHGTTEKITDPVDIEFINLVRVLHDSGLNLNGDYMESRERQEYRKGSHNSMEAFLSLLFDCMIDEEKEDINPFHIEWEKKPQTNRESLKQFMKKNRPLAQDKLLNIAEIAKIDILQANMDMALRNMKPVEKARLISMLKEYYAKIDAEIDIGVSLSQFICNKIQIYLDTKSGKISANPDFYNLGSVILRPRTVSEANTKKYAPRLIMACHNICPVRGCVNQLSRTFDDGQNVPVCDIARISPDDGEDYENLIPLCHDHYDEYIQLTDEPNEESVFYNLGQRKKMFTKRESIDFTLSEHKVRERLDRLIQELNLCNFDDILRQAEEVKDSPDYELVYDPKRIDEKIKPDDRHSIELLEKISRDVTRYYPFVKNRLSELNEDKEINEDKLRRSIKALYEDLSDKNLIGYSMDYSEIIEAISKWMHDVTDEDIDDCKIIISCFIQSCEIFRPI